MRVVDATIGLDEYELRAFRQGGQFCEMVMDISAAILRRHPGLERVDILNGECWCDPILGAFHRDGCVTSTEDRTPFPAAGNWLLEPPPTDGMSRRVLPCRTL